MTRHHASTCTCRGTGWVCEEHPTQPYGFGDYQSPTCWCEAPATEGTLPGEEDRDLIGALTLLADSARKTLAAGPTGAEIAEQLRRALDVRP